MMIWMRLVEGLIKATGEGPPGGEDPGRTDLPVHVISYFFMVWISVILGGVLLIEQYFGRRIHCFNPEAFNQPAPAIGEYCWRHGDFASMSNETGIIEYALPDQGWLLQTYVYYFLRAFVFYLPHILWNTKCRQWVSAVLYGSRDLVKELQTLWLKYEDIADNDYNEYEITCDTNNSISKTPAETKQIQRRQQMAAYNAVKAMTRDVVNITKQQIPKYSNIRSFLQLRMLYDLIFVCAIVIMDFILFVTNNQYDSTDFYCKLPNEETIRCMVPMMQFQWHASLLGLVCSLFVLLVTFHHTLVMIATWCSSSTAGCFLEHIPFTGIVADISWDSSSDRRTYKVISMFLMQNICILHPLNFMEAFIQNMLDSGMVPENVPGGSKALQRQPLEQEMRLMNDSDM